MIPITLIVLFILATTGLFFRDQYLERQRKTDLRLIREKIDDVMKNINKSSTNHSLESINKSSKKLYSQK